MTHPVIETYHHVPATVVAPDPRAGDVAEHISGLICDRFPQATVEHIGSTAIPSCAGKGIVDLLVGYPDGMLVACRDAVDSLGFQRQTFGAPFPEERPMRVGTIRHHGRTYGIHAHIVAHSSEEAAMMRCFRDCLRADPTLVRAYVDRKLDLIDAGVVRSPDYALAKGGFIRAVLATAAHATGLPPR